MANQHPNPIDLSQYFGSPTQRIGTRDIVEFIFGRVNIELSGACGPSRDAPYQCYYPVHQAYPSPQRRIVTECEQSTMVLDKDIVSTWRLPDVPAACEVFVWEEVFDKALGNGTAFVAIEEFLDGETGTDNLGAYCSVSTVVLCILTYNSQGTSNRDS